jgi:hypothetical protein
MPPITEAGLKMPTWAFNVTEAGVPVPVMFLQARRQRPGEVHDLEGDDLYDFPVGRDIHVLPATGQAGPGSGGRSGRHRRLMDTVVVMGTVLVGEYGPGRRAPGGAWSWACTPAG